MVKLEELNLSNRTFNCLQGWRYSKLPHALELTPEYTPFDNIYTIEHLIDDGIEELSKRPHMGKKGLNEIIYKVRKYAENHKIKFDEERFLRTNKIVSKIIPDHLGNIKIKNGYVYAIEARVFQNDCSYLQRYTKIGLSRNFPTSRLSAIKTSCPLAAVLTGYIKTDDMFDLEKRIHKKFKEFRYNGEWFDLEYLKIKELSEFQWTDYA